MFTDIIYIRTKDYFFLKSFVQIHSSIIKPGLKWVSDLLYSGLYSGEGTIAMYFYGCFLFFDCPGVVLGNEADCHLRIGSRVECGAYN
jgi:hypothetical protein